MKKNSYTQYLFGLSEKFLAKYGQVDAGPPAGSPAPIGAPSQTYYISELEKSHDPSTAKTTRRFQIEGPPRDWDAAANLAARKFYNQPTAERAAGTFSGLFYIEPLQQYFEIE